MKRVQEASESNDGGEKSRRFNSKHNKNEAALITQPNKGHGKMFSEYTENKNSKSVRGIIELKIIPYSSLPFLLKY